MDASPDPESPRPSLTPTARVILGMIALGKQTGYDIKQLVDQSTRHFWAASYGQIYPELRRLEEQGLISGQPEPRGGRARTVYRLTPAGEAAFSDWLGDTEEELPFEVRAESMLKLFFSDAATPEQRIENVRAMRESHERTLAQLESMRSGTPDMRTGPRLTIDLGIGLNSFIVEWCKHAERQLNEETSTERGGDDRC